MICWRRKYKQCATSPDWLWFITDNESIIGRFLLRHFISPIPLQVVIVLLLLSVLYIPSPLVSLPSFACKCTIECARIVHACPLDQSIGHLLVLVLVRQLYQLYLYLYTSYTNPPHPVSQIIAPPPLSDRSRIKVERLQILESRLGVQIVPILSQLRRACQSENSLKRKGNRHADKQSNLKRKIS